jgi:hypothetical protein
MAEQDTLKSPRKKVPTKKLQAMVSAIADRIAADKTAPADQKLSIKELTGLVNAVARITRPLIMADKDNKDERINKVQADRKGWL